MLNGMVWLFVYVVPISIKLTREVVFSGVPSISDERWIRKNEANGQYIPTSTEFRRGQVLANRKNEANFVEVILNQLVGFELRVISGHFVAASCRRGSVF